MKLKPPKNNVTWTEDTIDNEHMNKRKSKSKSDIHFRFNLHTHKFDVFSPRFCSIIIVCCKYEKPKTHPDDTSSSSSCDSDDDRACNNYDRYPRHQRKAMRAKE